ncbi:MAG: hypothetical protein ACKOPC_05815, partial [Methylocystis sp.]
MLLRNFLRQHVASYNIMILNNKLEYIINSKEISSLKFPNFILGLAVKSFFLGVFGVVFPSA